MGIVKKKFAHLVQLETKTPADKVLSASSDPTVHISDVYEDEGLKLALYLQLHDDAHQPLERRTALAKWAYRNHNDRRIVFRREILCEGGVTSDDYSPDSTVPLLMAKTGKYVEGIAPDSTLVVARHDPTNVRSLVSFLEPSSLTGLEAPGEFGVTIPSSCEDAACSCCSAKYPI